MVKDVAESGSSLLAIEDVSLTFGGLQVLELMRDPREALGMSDEQVAARLQALG